MDVKCTLCSQNPENNKYLYLRPVHFDNVHLKKSVTVSCLTHKDCKVGGDFVLLSVA